jgi:hypothetical protein
VGRDQTGNAKSHAAEHEERDWVKTVDKTRKSSTTECGINGLRYDWVRELLMALKEGGNKEEQEGQYKRHEAKPVKLNLLHQGRAGYLAALAERVKQEQCPN